jgi:hypothetical protein
MALEDEPADPSETRIITGAEERRPLERALEEARLHLVHMEATPTTQRLKLALDILRQTVEAWSTRAPTREQLDLVRDHVAEVLVLAKRSAPTLRPRLRRSA